MKKISRRVLCIGALTWCGLVSANPTWPNKPITLVVPFAPGGTTDILARLMAHELTQELGQQMVVENKAGAGGSIGTQAVAKAAPDGYTWVMGTVNTHGINKYMYKNLPYDPEKDFIPLSRVANVPNLLVTNPQQKFRTVQELINFTKSNPGKVSFGSSGNGTSVHLSGELFKLTAGVDIQHVPYKGSGPAVADLLGNQISIIFDNLPTVMPHVKSGKLIPIAITTSKRSAELPDVPSISEALPGYEVASWFGLFLPAKTPDDIVSKAHAAVFKVLNKPDVKAKLISQGAEPQAESSENFSKFMSKEFIKWKDVVEKGKLQLD